MSAPGDNQTDGRPVNAWEQWRRYDRLPTEIRFVYMFAPYHFEIPDDPKPSKPHLLQRMFATRDKLIAKTYGPDHPQIGSRIPERRRR